MSKIIIAKNELETKPIIGEGAYSKCFLHDENTVLKVFNKKCDIFPDHIEKFFNFDDTTFKFPRDFVIYNDEIIGYSMHKANGNPIRNLDSNIKIEELILELNNAREKIIRLSNEGIYLQDLSEMNVFYKNSFSFVDTDSYEIFKKTYVELCKKENLKLFSKEFLYFFIGDTNAFKLLYGIEELNDMLINFELGYPIDLPLLLEFYIKRIESKNNIKIETYQDYKNAILTLKK